MAMAISVRCECGHAWEVEDSLAGTQILATLFDGITRHSPEGRWFQQLAATEGFHAAVEWRDSGRWKASTANWTS